jgi:hypothetical protein
MGLGTGNGKGGAREGAGRKWRGRCMHDHPAHFIYINPNKPRIWQCARRRKATGHEASGG